MYFAPLTNRIFNKIKSAIGWELSESQETEQPNEISKTSETEKPEPDYCPQAVSKLKAYQQQHQKLQTIFDEFLSQVPFLPDVKWDEPFMSSPYYKDITKASKAIFDNLYDAKEEARKKLEELKEIINHKIEQEFSKLTLEEKINYLYSRCFGPTTQYQQPIPDLKRYELEFLYDNYQNQKLAEIITHRDKNPDMLKIFDCTPDQIVHNQQELQQAIQDKKEIKAYVGRLFPNFFQVVPQNIEYIYTKFPEGKIIQKTIKLGTGLKTKEAFINAIEKQGGKVEIDWDKSFHYDFSISNQNIEQRIILIQLGSLISTWCTFEQMLNKAKEFGLNLCSSETAFQLLLQYQGLLGEGCIFFPSEKPIYNGRGGEFMFQLFPSTNNHNPEMTISRIANIDRYKPTQLFAFVRPNNS